QIHLIEYDNLWTRCQVLIVFTQFLVDCLKILPGIAFECCPIKHVYQQACTLDMPQELMPKANTLSGTFNQTRDIGKHKAKFIATGGLTDRYYSKIRCERGERIFRNLRLCSSDD